MVNVYHRARKRLTQGLVECGVIFQNLEHEHEHERHSYHGGKYIQAPSKQTRSATDKYTFDPFTLYSTRLTAAMKVVYIGVSHPLTAVRAASI